MSLCVCLRMCTCVYVWQGLNRQQLPQGKVYSVDMLLKQNFPIPANQSRYIYDEHVVLQDTAPHVRYLTATGQPLVPLGPGHRFFE